MEKKKNVDATILEILADGSKPLPVTKQTQEMVRIIAASNLVYSDLLDWIEQYWSSDESNCDEAYNAWVGFRDYLNGWLAASINDCIGHLPFDGI